MRAAAKEAKLMYEKLKAENERVEMSCIDEKRMGYTVVLKRFGNPCITFEHTTRINNSNDEHWKRVAIANAFHKLYETLPADVASEFNIISCEKCEWEVCDE